MLTLRDLHDLTSSHAEELTLPVREFSLGEKRFGGERTDLMGVVNLSPDSWYRESVCMTTEQAVRRGKKLAIEGAALVDLGAESTLLHAERADAKRQSSRLLPVVKELSQAGILVSVETYEPIVAQACLEAGARVLNITTAGNLEPLLSLAGEYRAAVILCYLQSEGNVREAEDFIFAPDHVAALEAYFQKALALAERCQVPGMWIDPGMGFYYKNLKDSQQRVRYQMETFLQTFRLRKLGWPVCHALPHAFEMFGEEVRSAEGFFALLALLGQTGLLRTHEIARVRGVLKTMEAW